MAKTTPQPKGTRVKAEMWDNPPETLDKHPFYGLKLDNEQKAFRDAIWNPKNQITFVNAGAGSGKTLISVATANLMVRYGLFDEIIYITSPCHERKQGFLSGSLFEKSLQYFYPLYDALTSIGIQPDKVVHSDDENVEKFGSPYIRPMTDSFIRGRNFGTRESRVIVQLDEAQNTTIGGIKTVLSRIGEGSIAIVTGHTSQCDLKKKSASGFEKCIEHFRGQPWATVCELKTNYRSDISRWADMLPDDD